MKTLAIFSYNNGSNGAKNLSAALNVKRIKHEGSKFKGNNNKVVINWGAPALPAEVKKCVVLNADTSVASNKLLTFQKLKGKKYCPDFWSKEDISEDLEQFKALKEVMDKGGKIVCRKILNGHSGNGIIISEKIEALADAPLYVKYIPKKDEYRIHVVKGKVIHIQRKARKKDVPDEKVNWQVRNLDGGFIFQQEGFVAPDDVVNSAIDAVATLGLDFGAVDVIWNDKSKSAYVLEVNTAPGIEGTTVEKYAKAFAKEIE